MNYSAFVTYIGQWINRTNGEIDDIIQQQIVESQYALEKKFKFWPLIDEYTSVLAANDFTLKLPNYMISVTDIEIIDSSTGTRYPIRFIPGEAKRDWYPDISGTNAETGRPKVATLRGHVIHFSPPADEAYSVRIWGHHHLDALEEDDDTNVWTTIYLTALRLHVLVNLEPYLGSDERIVTWKTLLKDILDDLKKEETQMALSGLQETVTDTEDVYL